MNGSNTELQTVSITKNDGVATVTLRRPEALNAYNMQMRDDLAEVLSWLHVDPDVRVCVFAGAGRAFCAGADLTEFGTAPSVTIARRVRWQRDIWEQLLRLPQPTIAMLHGYAIGSGLELALCCDLRLAARGTIVALPETRLGFIPAAGGTQLLPRVVRLGWASHMILSGARVTADEAFRANLVNDVFPDEDALRDATVRLAKHLAELPPRAVQQAKRALQLAEELPAPIGLVVADVLRREMLSDQHTAGTP